MYEFIHSTCVLHVCAVVAYGISKHSCPCLALCISSNWISTRFPKCSSRASSPLRENVEDCFRFANVQRGHAEIGSAVNALSRFVRFPLTALGCLSMTRRWKGPCGQTLEIVNDCQRERKQVLFHTSLAQTWLHLLSGEFPHCA